MIDFRYHLVSLVAVFIALAIGIVLGAGPLRENLGDALTSQVEQLRMEREEMRKQNSVLTQQINQANSYIEASAKELVVKTLSPVNITIIQDSPELGGTSQETAELLTLAGSQKVQLITVNSALWEAEKETLIAAENKLLTEIPNLIEAGIRDYQHLTDDEEKKISIENLTKILVALNDENFELSLEARSKGIEILYQSGFINANAQDFEPSKALIYLSKPVSNPAETQNPNANEFEAEEHFETFQYTFTRASLNLDAGLVVASQIDPLSPSNIVNNIREDEVLKLQVATVDSTDLSESPTLIVLAMAHKIAIGSDHFGSSATANRLIPDLLTIRDNVQFTLENQGPEQ